MTKSSDGLSVESFSTRTVRNRKDDIASMKLQLASFDIEDANDANRRAAFIEDTEKAVMRRMSVGAIYVKGLGRS